MAWFISVRGSPSGGFESNEAYLCHEQGVLADQHLALAKFSHEIRGKDLVLLSHGFNVSQEHGLKSLYGWSGACSLPSDALFIGLLWPGDSTFFPILDYPVEGQVAMRSAPVLAKFIDTNLGAATSISFVSHSLGARFVLETLRRINQRASKLILMAGAIEDDCFTNEYRICAQKADAIHVIASRKDWVLEFAFPIGNPVGEVIMRGHPYFRCALGREGPATAFPFGSHGRTWQIPDGWNYGHLDYMPSGNINPLVPPVQGPPDPTQPYPAWGNEWKPRWSAGMVSVDMT